jgi:hypothetical protein
MAAAPNLSCSHLNCLGLSVHLACATRPGAPFEFILFDDPVQSMDEGHTEAFKIEVMEKLLKAKRQVILFTHLDNFAHDIDTRHRPHCELYRLNFLGHSEHGPEIEEVFPRIENLLAEARSKMEASNEAYRAISVEYLRRFVERFIKDLWVVQTRKGISRRYQKATWSDLKNLLLQCNNFDPMDESRLEHTHTFTSRHLHEDESAAQPVPQPHQIRSHVEDMDKVLQKYAKALGLQT